MVTLKVRGDTPIQKLAGAIGKNLRENGAIDVSIVGPIALNRAVKACIIARKFLKSDEKPSDLYIQPDFRVQVNDNSSVDNPEVTCIILHIYKTEFNEERSVTI